MMGEVSTLKEYENSKERAQAPIGGGKENANEEIEAESVAVKTKEMQSLGDASRVPKLDDGRACQGNEPDKTMEERVTHPPTAEEEQWEVQKIVNDTILLISSTTNIRRKEMQSRCKESAKNPDPEGGTVSIEEAKNS